MSPLITLTCPSCGAKAGVTESVDRFHCEYCGNDHLLRLPGQPVAQTVTPIRPKIKMPDSVQIEKDGKSARIIQRWFSLKYVPMAFFCVAWDGFLCFWYSMALGSGAPVIFIIFPILHLAVGIGLTYSTLAGFLNRTYLELTQDQLSIWFEPLPWLGEKTIQTADLKQLYCKETISHGKRSTTSHYHLYAVTRDGHELKLLSNISSPEVVLFLEEQLEKWLRIENRPVAGEFSRF